MKIKQKLVQIALIAGFVLLAKADLQAQNSLPFINEITAFRKQDSVSFPKKKAILFVGSSSFRMWKDVQQAFPEHTIINRGFGGSSLPDVIRYADQIIYPYKPKQVLIYCGENDLTAPGVTGEMVFERFKTLFGMIRGKLPKTRIGFVSIKPSPSRAKLQPEVIKANALIKDFLAGQKRADYIDIFSKMLNADGSMKEELFLADRLHMKANGYAIWQQEIRPYLVR